MSTKKKLLEAAAGNAGEAVYADDVFSTYLYEGNGALRDIENGIDLAGEGGMVWIKGRESTNGNVLFDTERGPNKFLYSYTNTEEFSGASLSGFNSNGFELASGNTQVNPTSAESMVSWTFRKQPGFFDIVTYTGNGGSNRAISHNLGSKPGLVIIKDYGQSAGWMVGTGFTSTQYYRLALETSAAASGGGLANYNNYLSAEPTTTTFSVGNEGLGNANGQTYVAYLFANDAQDFGTDEDESIIKCGSYTGTNAAGNAINLGFEPQWVMIKGVDSPSNWWISDSIRGITSGHTVTHPTLRADDSGAEVNLDILTLTPTGFEAGDYAAVNNSGDEYIYMAIRRPNKPAEEFAATDLFNAVSQSTDTSLVTSGFPIDMVIMGDLPTSWGYNWSVQDRLRGGKNVLFTSSSAAENTGSLTTLDSNTGLTNGWVSGGTTGLFQMFKRAPGFFDVVAYTGNGVAGRTVAHNLGAVPEMMWVKCRSLANTAWRVYIKDATTDPNYGINTLVLNDDDGWNPNNAGAFTSVPTETSFAVSSFPSTNGSGQTFIAYLFATVAGVSKVGSYTGTGNDLNVDCGFSAGARFILIKRSDTTGDWYVWDSVRGIVAGNDPYLLLNSTAAEVTSTDYIDPLSSGFTVTSSAPAALNASGGTYIFYAIA